MIQYQNNNIELISKRKIQMLQKKNSIKKMQEKKVAVCNYNAIEWNTNTN